MMSMGNGILFVLSGPSGVGKGTVLEKLMEDYNGVSYSVSVTTRKPRSGEIDGEDYFFVSEEEFKKMKKNGDFIESARVHGNYYGTPKKFVDRKISKGEDIILEIDIQGAVQVREKYPDAVYIFLIPPSLEELENRLNKRGSEDSEAKTLRLKNAKSELQEVHKYDYEILNDNLEDAVEDLKYIIEEEKKRRDKNDY
ncbi:guanylate kinase [Halanaerobium sp. DL-01]|nr:guanylate kinase [Halanaerobium sp. DL-01]